MVSLRNFFSIFLTIFLAELGDKTQVATFLFSTDKSNSKAVVFIAASLALLLSTCIAVLLGDFLSKHINQKVLSWIAGSGFILIGILMILRT